MSGYEQLLQRLEEEPSLQYLKEDYKEVIKSLSDSNLSLKKMIAIILAAETDCYKFTSEIEKQQQYIASLEEQLFQNHSVVSKVSYEPGEFKEIIYEYEDKLQHLVQLLSQNGLLSQQLQNQENIDPRQAMNIIEDYIHQKCENGQIRSIINQNMERQMVKQQQKYFELQMENMKMMSNINPNDQQLHKKLYLRDKIKSRLRLALRQLRDFSQELKSIKATVQDQYKLCFQEDDLIDKLKTVDNFRIIYENIYRSLKLFNYHQLNKIVKQGLQACKDLSSKDILMTIEKLQKKLVAQITKTQTYIHKQLDTIIKYDIKDINSLQNILQQTQTYFQQINQINTLVFDIYKEKDFLEKQVRNQLTDVIHKMSSENSKFKMIILTKALEKPVSRKSVSSFSSLKSISYN